MATIPIAPPMNSKDLAYYLESTDNYHQPWLLVQLRLAKLAEEKDTLAPQEYADRLADIHRDLMTLGQWWTGRETEVF
jgi:hypothetical protein